jgi:hypothetical protein
MVSLAGAEEYLEVQCHKLFLHKKFSDLFSGMAVLIDICRYFLNP